MLKWLLASVGLVALAAACSSSDDPRFRGTAAAGVTSGAGATTGAGGIGGSGGAAGAGGAASSCTDGIKNGDEEDVDCGGGCPPCPKKIGEGCQSDGECASLACADGVCCETSCAGPCVACVAQKTGAADGTCAPVTAKTDPDGECAATGKETCGVSGEGCNGEPAAPGCLLWSASTECTAPSCAADQATAAALCDGKGTCVPGQKTPCAPYVCDAAGVTCLADCGDDAACVTGFYCDKAAKQCKPQGNTGTACSATNQCTSGHCADGVCCNTACAGGCDVCAQKVGAPIDGACTVLGAGATGDPSCTPYVCDGAGALCPQSCGDDKGCVATHYCDASGACTPKLDDGAGCPKASACKSGHCVDGVCCNTACADSCDVCAAVLGASMDGTCTLLPDGAPGLPDCTLYLCDGLAAACPTSCKGDADCIDTHYCSAMSCLPKKAKGATCAGSGECQAGLLCVDGRCCTGACDGLCEACNLAGKEGDCALIPNGQDPANECVGHCDGAGNCAGPTYTFDAQPIYKKYCAPCHSMFGSGSHNIATVYGDAFLASYYCVGQNKGQCTIVRIKNGSMPPGAGCTGNPAMDKDNANCLTAAEQATIDAWIMAGMPL
jgi:hypothetical protein